MNTELGIQFVKASGSNPFRDSVTAQTGDVAWIAILAMFVVAIVGFFAFFLARNKEVIFAKHSSASFIFKDTNLFLSIKAKLVIVAVVSALSLVFALSNCISNAHASQNNAPIVTDKNTITASVFEDGSISFDVCNLSNVCRNEFGVLSSSVCLTEEAKTIEELQGCNINITGFNGVLFTGEPSSEEYTPTGLSNLSSGTSTPIIFDVKFEDDSVVEKLIDKQVFKLSIKSNIVLPIHETLDSYSWSEIQSVAYSISDGYVPEAELNRFKDFAQKGQTKKLTLGAHDNVDEDYLYMRIIGINHNDVAGSTTGQKAGLTFIAANSINQAYKYDWGETEREIVLTPNWAASKLHHNMNSGSVYRLLSNALSSVNVNPETVVVQYAKGWPTEGSPYYDYSILSENSKFFLPSIYELWDSESESLPLEGKRFEYTKNDPWAQVPGCVWHEQSGGYSGPGPVMSTINWKGFEYLKNASADLFQNNIYEVFAILLNSGCVVSGIESNEHTFERTITPYRMLSQNYFASALKANGSASDIASVETYACINPCFCL